MKKKYLRHLISASFLLFFFLVANIASAQGLVPEAGKADGNYKMEHFIELAVNVSQLILGLVGSLSLVMFIYGGVTFILSAGSSEKIGEAKKIIVASVVGLIIVFSSWLIIKFAVDTLGYKKGFDGTVNVSMTEINLN